METKYIGAIGTRKRKNAPARNQVSCRKPGRVMEPTMSDELPYNVFDDRCPARLVLDRLADKWALLILDRLKPGPQRFNALKRDVQRITQKVLTQTLRRLERDGLVSREVFATVPVTVEYALTPLGRTLTKTVSALAHWAERNMDAVLAAQAAFDAAAEEAARPRAGVHRLRDRPAPVKAASAARSGSPGSH